MESLPNINLPGRRQLNTARGAGANSPHIQCGEQAANLCDNSHNQPHAAYELISPPHYLDLPDKPPNGSLGLQRPVVAGHVEQGVRERDKCVNKTEIDVTVSINDSLKSKYASNEPAAIHADILTADEVTRRHFKSSNLSGTESTTFLEPESTTLQVKSRTNSTSSTGNERRGSSKLSRDDDDLVSGYRLLKASESIRTKYRGLSPRRERGIPDGVLTRKERQTVRSLISPPLVDHLSPEDAWGEARGNRRRSRSDVRYDALPVLDNGEIDARSYRLAPSPVHKPKHAHRGNTHSFNDLDSSLPLQDGTSRSNEKLYPLSEEQEHGGSHPQLTKHHLKEAEHFARHAHGLRSTAEPFNNHIEDKTSHPLHVNAARQHRRNAIAHIMDSFTERSRSNSYKGEHYATVSDETFQRQRRDTCAVNPGALTIRFKQGGRDALSIPKRRRAYSDLSDKSLGKSTAARKMSINSQQRMIRAQSARQRFAHAIKMVIILLRIHSMVFQKRKHSHNKETMTFTEIAEQFQSTEMKSSGLSFDPRDFKAKREINISNEAKNILNMPSYSRTPDQLQTALYGLQTMKSFAEYPLHMQEKLVKVAWFECIPPKRVIIRQGHYAENFYFVISGSVIVTIMETRANTGEAHIRTAAVLRKGSSFGELALLHHSKRTATVASQGEVQLLAIGREDFFDIFMRGQQPGEEPEHVKYLRQLSFMKHWPAERLIEHPEMCLFHFYKRGQVIVQDSNKSDWLYIVKSGSCQVLKQLNAVKPSLSHRSSSLSAIRLPKLHARHLSAPELKTKRPIRTRIRNHSATASYLQFISVPTVSSVNNTSTVLDVHHNLLVNDPFEGARSLPDTFLTRQMTTVDARSAPSESNFSQVTFEDSSTATSLPRINGGRGATPSRESFSRSKFREIARRNPPPTAARKSFAPKAMVTDDHTSSDSSSSTESRGSVFVQIEHLLPKDVFGLSTLSVDLGIDHKQSSVNLVSSGAECIMIQKDFFAKYCTEEVKHHIRSLIKPYPPPEMLQHNLQNHSNWTNYKQEAVASILRDRSKAKELRL